MKNICLSFGVLAIVFVFSGCTKNNDGSGNEAQVMFVNGCSGTNDVDVKVNGVVAAGSGSISYFGNSGYQGFSANSNLNIDFYLLQGTYLIGATRNFTQHYRYTVYAGGLVTSPSFVVTTDEFPTLPSGKAAVRFINLSNDSLNESFSVGAATLDSNIGYTICSPYFEIAASSGTGVTAVDPRYTSSPFLATLPSQAFSAGKIYTVMLTGSSTASTAPAVLKLTVIQNN